MKNQKKSIVVLAMILFTILFFLNVNVFSDEGYVPPPPDKSKTLPASDGEPDGCNSSRFKCVMEGKAVQDRQSGLIWARYTSIANKALPWQEAMEFCQNLEIGNRKGWRLPTKEEFITILDTGQSNPALPEGHPFNNVPQSGSDAIWGTYWTSTEPDGDSSRAYTVGTNFGRVSENLKVFDSYAWPVLGGN